MGRVLIVFATVLVCGNMLIDAADADAGSALKDPHPVPGFLSDHGLVTDIPLDMVTLTDSDSESVSPSHLTSSCKAFIDAFGDGVAKFSKCMISFARPLRFCEHCVEYYIEAKALYNVLMEGTTQDESGAQCGDMILNSDRIQLIVKAANFIDDMWDNCACDNCFESDTNGTVSTQLNNRTLEFMHMALEAQQCFTNHSKLDIITPYAKTNGTNSTVCKDCSKIYKKLNELYADMEDHFHNHVCMDVVDAMNYTRLLWSRDFHCSQQQGDMLAVLIVSGLFSLMPVVFYLGNKIHGTKLQNKIVKQKRLRDVTGSMTESTS